MSRGDGALLGLFREPEAVVQALDSLRAVGFAGRELAVLSDSPYPAGAFGEEPVRHHLYAFPLAGAAAGLAAGLLLTIGTQLSYPLVTGGKPILAIPPMVNVLFELTMLGTILFTASGILFESRLPDFSPTPYDPRITEGHLGVLVTGAGGDGRLEAAARVLRQSGAVDVIGASDDRRRRTG